jgi:hypothetical protein
VFISFACGPEKMATIQKKKKQKIGFRIEEEISRFVGIELHILSE